MVVQEDHLDPVDDRDQEKHDHDDDHDCDEEVHVRSPPFRRGSFGVGDDEDENGADRALDSGHGNRIDVESDRGANGDDGSSEGDERLVIAR